MLISRKEFWVVFFPLMSGLGVFCAAGQAVKIQGIEEDAWREANPARNGVFSIHHDATDFHDEGASSSAGSSSHDARSAQVSDMLSGCHIVLSAEDLTLQPTVCKKSLFSSDKGTFATPFFEREGYTRQALMYVASHACIKTDTDISLTMGVYKYKGRMQAGAGIVFASTEPASLIQAVKIVPKPREWVYIAIDADFRSMPNTPQGVMDMTVCGYESLDIVLRDD